MSDNRVSPPFVADERTMLDNWLDWHRETLAVKCAGLTEDQLRERSAPPSTLSLLGLVRHMANVERAWFRRVLNGEDVPWLYKTGDDPDADLNAVDTASAEEAFATWRAEIAYAREISAAFPLDAVGKGKRHGQDCSHRWILIHMIEEYARHNGHADLLRERIDGATGE
ncbi:DinB family protein [Sphaerisporangium sp. TRM90804]|uniref:DinB family protein n=1 Tax=Sphaerisporangium sp. TRM90804 TaxID=3031113 RepID=UPI00244C4259|nr:DinB family protein [Sphaerisporangium sp. TRM90804]MDH2429951.1 DinB family protein [Sphaerisporangium sp. TRM90804]